MSHTTITAELVAEAERMLAKGGRQRTIAVKLGITPYIVGMIACNRRLEPRGKPLRHVSRRVGNYQKGIDAMTIRLIQRMLEIRMLPHSAIAREVGVAPSTVKRVASGTRSAISMWKPYLQEEEQFLAKPIHCRGCQKRIYVLPCRICQALTAEPSQKLA